MNLDQTQEIVQRVCTVEGRTLTADMVKAWHGLLQDLEATVAGRACSLALTDHNIHQVGPKHVKAKVPAAVAELNQALRSSVSDEDTWRSDPQPVCRSHGLPITDCGDCCGVLRFQVGHLRGDSLHSWAVQNLYAVN
jgi:hypothetical protein